MSYGIFVCAYHGDVCARKFINLLALFDMQHDFCHQELNLEKKVS